MPPIPRSHHCQLCILLAREHLVGAVVLAGAKVLRALDAQHAVEAVGAAAIAAPPGRRALAHHDVVLILHLAFAVAEYVVRDELPHGWELAAGLLVLLLMVLMRPMLVLLLPWQCLLLCDGQGGRRLLLQVCKQTRNSARAKAGCEGKGAPCTEDSFGKQGS